MEATEVLRQESLIVPNQTWPIKPAFRFVGFRVESFVFGIQQMPIEDQQTSDQG